MPDIVILNPIKVACPNKNCGAPAGVACKTVGKFINATPHTPRLKVVVGAQGVHQDPTRARAAIDAYTTAVLLKLLRRIPTADELTRAQRDGSLKPDKGWLKALIDERAPRSRRPKKRVDARGVTTYWGSVDEERQLPDGSFILQLDTGFVIRLQHNDGWQWAEWWPERKREAASLGHAKPRYRFEVAKNQQVTSVCHEEPLDDSEVVMPSKPVDDRQIGLGL